MAAPPPPTSTSRTASQVWAPAGQPVAASPQPHQPQFMCHGWHNVVPFYRTTAAATDQELGFYPIPPATPPAPYARPWDSFPPLVAQPTTYALYCHCWDRYNNAVSSSGLYPPGGAAQPAVMAAAAPPTGFRVQPVEDQQQWPP